MRCEVVVSGRLVSQRMAACPLEPRGCAAVVGDDGRLTLWLSTQTPHQDRDELARILGLEPADVRVVAPDVGGGFGAKMLGVEEVLVAWLARRLGRPVRWAETRSENMIAMPHGRAAMLEFTIGGTPRRNASRPIGCASCRTPAPIRASGRSCRASPR